jgi:ankyrin repeat protein
LIISACSFLFFVRQTIGNVDYLSIRPGEVRRESSSSSLLLSSAPLVLISSMQSLTVNDEVTDAHQSSLHVSSRTSTSLLSKLTDAKKSLFGRSNVPEPYFSSATHNKVLLTYILSEPYPQLDVIQEFERNGAQLHAITDDGNTLLHLLARTEIRSVESLNIVEYLTRKGGCDANKQNDYGWTAGHLPSTCLHMSCSLLLI